ncbi:hypothetical protein BH23ACT10_BH23ACT10_09740 [soil metagenome]
MLRFAVYDLLAEGARVVLVARRPGLAGTQPGLLAVAADWTDPGGFATTVGSALGDVRPAEALLWVHSPYAARVHAALDPLLHPHAVVVQLYGSAASDLRSVPVPTEYGPPRCYRRVVLGYVDEPDAGTRWLTDREISDGAVAALRDPASRWIVGRVDPWDDHP